MVSRAFYFGTAVGPSSSDIFRYFSSRCGYFFSITSKSLLRVSEVIFTSNLKYLSFVRTYLYDDTDKNRQLIEFPLDCTKLATLAIRAYLGKSIMNLPLVEIKPGTLGFL